MAGRDPESTSPSAAAVRKTLFVCVPTLFLNRGIQSQHLLFHSICPSLPPVSLGLSGPRRAPAPRPAPSTSTSSSPSSPSRGRGSSGGVRLGLGEVLQQHEDALQVAQQRRRVEELDQAPGERRADARGGVVHGRRDGVADEGHPER